MSQLCKSACQITAKAPALCPSASSAPAWAGEKRARVAIYFLGLALVALSLPLDAAAQAQHSQQEIDAARNAVTQYLVSSIDVFVMLAALIVAPLAGLGALITGLLKHYKIAIGLAVLSLIAFAGFLGAFIFRSMSH